MKIWLICLSVVPLAGMMKEYTQFPAIPEPKEPAPVIVADPYSGLGNILSFFWFLQSKH